MVLLLSVAMHFAECANCANKAHQSKGMAMRDIVIRNEMDFHFDPHAISFDECICLAHMTTNYNHDLCQLTLAGPGTKRMAII